MEAEGMLPASSVRWISGSSSATTRSTLTFCARVSDVKTKSIAATLMTANRRLDQCFIICASCASLWLVSRLRYPVNRRGSGHSSHRILFEQLHRFLNRPLDLRIAPINHRRGSVLDFDVWGDAFILNRPLT